MIKMSISLLFTASPGDKISLTDKLKKQLRITSSLVNALQKKVFRIG